MPPNKTDAVESTTLPVIGDSSPNGVEKVPLVSTNAEAVDLNDDVISVQPRESDKLTLPSKTALAEDLNLKDQFDTVSCFTCLGICCEFISQSCMAVAACCQAGCGECINGTCEGCLSCCEACGQCCLVCTA